MRLRGEASMRAGLSMLRAGEVMDMEEQLSDLLCRAEWTVEVLSTPLHRSGSVVSL